MTRVHISTPFEAQQIAQNAMHWMTAIRGATSKAELSSAWQNWKTYADGAHVCFQIKEHMSGVYAETAARLPAARVVRDPTGEAK